MTFEIPMYNVSNLQVKYLSIAEAGYNPYRWVRYVTRSSSWCAGAGDAVLRWRAA